MMNPETLQAAVEAAFTRQPFHPFTLVMDDGQELENDSPVALAIRNGTAMFVSPGGTPHWFNSESVNRVVSDLMFDPQDSVGVK